MFLLYIDNLWYHKVYKHFVSHVYTDGPKQNALHTLNTFNDLKPPRLFDCTLSKWLWNLSRCPSLAVNSFACTTADSLVPSTSLRSAGLGPRLSRWRACGWRRLWCSVRWRRRTCTSTTPVRHTPPGECRVDISVYCLKVKRETSPTNEPPYTESKTGANSLTQRSDFWSSCRFIFSPSS